VATKAHPADARRLNCSRLENHVVLTSVTIMAVTGRCVARGGGQVGHSRHCEVKSGSSWTVLRSELWECAPKLKSWEDVLLRHENRPEWSFSPHLDELTNSLQ